MLLTPSETWRSLFQTYLGREPILHMSHRRDILHLCRFKFETQRLLSLGIFTATFTRHRLVVSYPDV